MSSPALALAERSASELAALRKLAIELAHARKERATSLHLLAAIADRPGSAADLLRERRLDRDALLKAGRSFDEDGPDAMLRALAEAREVQKRVRTPLPTDRVKAGPAQLSPDSRHVMTEPTALHLLIALLGERRFAACRALATIGIDLARLRASAVQQALGLVATRRVAARMLEAPQSMAPAAAPPRPTGVAVPLLPPAPRPRPVMTTLATPVATAVPPPRMRSSRPAPAPRPVQRPTQHPPHDTGEAPPASTPEALRERAPITPVSEPARTSLDPALFPLLAALGRDLVAAARAGELAPVIGREAEIERVLDVLAKLRANVPVLVGPPGVGKTAVAHGLAERFARGPLRSRKLLIEIGVPDLVAGTGTRGALAERLARLRAEIARADGEIVLFVDEIHELFAGGAADEGSAELRVALARGELPLLGATTADSFKKAVEADPTLARRVVAIEIEEPTVEDAFLQVRGASARLATHHRLAFDEEAIAAAIGWSVRYLPGRALPDKALALLDLAGARRKRVLDENEGPFQAGAANGKLGKSSGARRLRMEDVAPVVAEQASIPEERLLETDAERMLALEKTLGERVVGRESALAKIATLLRRNAVGLRGRRPIGTFLLLGPTGVGKTETAKAIAEALFDSPDAMTRLDLSEFAEAHAIAKLIGAPPGYVGHEAGGQLTEALRKRPYQVVLLDEVEKAHRDVLQAFLQVFDEGRMTDGRGRLVDFTNTVIVLTSNLGVAELRHARDRRGIGFGGAAGVSVAALEDAVVGAAKKALAPELFNRIDEVVFYPPLERAQIAEIARKLLEEVAVRLEEKGVTMQVDDDGIEALLNAGGYDPELGARPMRRAIGRLVEAPIAERLLRRELPSGATVIVGAEDGKVAIDAVLP